jgi:hypothetical protein
MPPEYSQYSKRGLRDQYQSEDCLTVCNKKGRLKVSVAKIASTFFFAGLAESPDD